MTASLLHGYDGGVPDRRDTATEDDHIDLLNDETFGNDQEDFDWDDATDENEVESMQLQTTLEMLVVDDEPDDPAIITVHSRRIPQKNQNLDNLYGPQSPPAFVSSLDNLLHPTHDIWGSPNVGLHSQETPRSAPDTGARAHATYTPSESPGLPLPATVMTVEELERKLCDQPASSPTTSSNMSMSGAQADNASVPCAAGSHKPLEYSLSRDPVMVPGSPLHRPLFTARPPGLFSPPPEPFGPPLIIPRERFRPPQMSTHEWFRPHFNQEGFGPPRMHDVYGQQNMFDMHRAHVMHRAFRPPMMFNGQRPPMFNGLSQFGPNGPFVPHPSVPPGFPPRNPLAVPGHMVAYPPILLPMQQQDLPPAIGSYQIDEYAGLMSQSEKDWLLKIQHLQLHTDDPFTDDYYYTIRKLEKNSKNGTAQSIDFILPAFAKLEDRSYRPAQFEGSLGRLTTSSVNKPRQVLDVGGREDHVSHAVETRKYRHALIQIEKGFSLILEVDEITKKIPSVVGDQAVQLQHRLSNSLATLSQLIDEHLQSIMVVRKGRDLMLRSCGLIDKAKGRDVLHNVLDSLQLFLRKEAVDAMQTKYLGCISHVLSRCDMSAIIDFSRQLDAHLPVLFKTCFGCLLFCYLVQQAENIHAAFVNVSHSEAQLWLDFLRRASRTILAEKSIPKTPGVPLAVRDHFERFSQEPDVLAVTNKLQNWFQFSV